MRQCWQTRRSLVAIKAYYRSYHHNFAHTSGHASDGKQDYRALYAATGQLNRLPHVLDKKMMLESAHARSNKIKTPSIESDMKRFTRVRIQGDCRRKKVSKRAYAAATKRVSSTKLAETLAQKYDIFASTLEEPLLRWLPQMPHLDSLHPFEREVVQLTLPNGFRSYTRCLKGVERLASSVKALREKEQADRKKIKNTYGIQQWFEKAIKRMEQLFQERGVAIDNMKATNKLLARCEVINPLLPTAALVGMPNVGKSSIVTAISSGSPEIKNYPFTTRAISMGHILLEGRTKGRNRIQVTDTPGVMKRNDEERYAMMRCLHFSAWLLTNAFHMLVVGQEQYGETDYGCVTGGGYALHISIRVHVRAVGC